jgi:hypothetical protein
MPKLNTTLDKIEIVNNKVIGTTASPAWTDAQYPSAKTLYNVYNRLSNEVNAKYPIDSIVCMASNTNPSMAGIPGTWSLIDKEFKHTWLTINSGAWTATNATFYDGRVALYGHEIMVRLQIKPKASPGDTTTVMGKLNFAHSSIGLPSSLYFGRSQGIATSDGHNATMCYDFAPDGTITSYDCLNVDGTHSLYSPTSYYLTFTDYFTCDYTSMPDTYCNKFYFKRIA